MKEEIRKKEEQGRRETKKNLETEERGGGVRVFCSYCVAEWGGDPGIFNHPSRPAWFDKNSNRARKRITWKPACAGRIGAVQVNKYLHTPTTQYRVFKETYYVRSIEEKWLD